MRRSKNWDSGGWHAKDHLCGGGGVLTLDRVSGGAEKPMQAFQKYFRPPVLRTGLSSALTKISLFHLNVMR